MRKLNIFDCVFVVLSSIVYATSLDVPEMNVNIHPCESGGILEIECCKNSSSSGMLELRDGKWNILVSVDFNNPPIKINSSYSVTWNTRCAVFSFEMIGEGRYICQMPSLSSVFINASKCNFDTVIGRAMMQQSLESSCEEDTDWFILFLIAVILLAICVIIGIVLCTLGCIGKIQWTKTSEAEQKEPENQTGSQ